MITNLDQPLHPEIHELSKMLEIDYFKIKFNEVVEIINNYKKEEKKISLTIGIEGDWGSGKTSFINYVNFFLENLSDDNYFVNFNIWDYTIDNIKEEFFKNLYFSLYKKPGFSSIFRTSAISLNLLGFGIKLSGNSFLENFDIFKFKEKIKDFLVTKNKYLFVIIDDLDRASKDEILRVFSLIKSGFDIPNIVFILLYSKEHLIDRIAKDFKNNEGKIDSSKAEKYLEKIIMQEIHYSQYITEQDIINLFSENILRKIKDKQEKILKNNSTYKYWFDSFFEQVLDYFLKKRKLNEEDNILYLERNNEKIPVIYISVLKLISYIIYLSNYYKKQEEIFNDTCYTCNHIEQVHRQLEKELLELDYRKWKKYIDLINKFIEKENSFTNFINFLFLAKYFLIYKCLDLKSKIGNSKISNEIKQYFKFNDNYIKKYFHCK